MFIIPCEGRITSRFQKNRLDPVNKKITRPHWGTDFGNHADNTIMASASGTVTEARVMGGFGNTVFILHNIGGRVYETVYAHLSVISVKKGQAVKQGQKIGVKGTTGNSTGIHLHFEICVGGRWNNSYTHNVDPEDYMINPAVKSLQAKLVKVGYKVSVDGLSGPATVSAVKLFQHSKGLTADGIAGSATIAELDKAIKSSGVKSVVKPVPKPVAKPVSKPKEEEKLDLNKNQRAELARVFAVARQKGIFSSDEHEKSIIAETMSISKLLYLQALIAGASINGGKRIK